MFHSNQEEPPALAPYLTLLITLPKNLPHWCELLTHSEWKRYWCRNAQMLMIHWRRGCLKMTRVILSSIESHKRQMSMYILFVLRRTLLCMTGNRRSKSTHMLCCCLNSNIMRVQRRTKQTTYLGSSQESCNFNLVCSMPQFASRLCTSVTAAGPALREEKQVSFGSSRGWRTDEISTSPCLQPI